MNRLILSLFFIVFLLPASAQEKKDTLTFTEAIEDNSFLIEEAYNQENHVVQHISNGYIKNNNFLCSFTQEWPVSGIKHQLSYTIPYSFLNSNSANGIGDVLINYRYQLFYKDKWACISPRLSFILPTGNSQQGLGTGSFGIQFNLPFSKRLSDYFVVHLNAGSTDILKAAGYDMTGMAVYSHNLSFYNFGGSIIWLSGSKFNFMFECLENLNSSLDLNGSVIHSSETIFNPGLRFAIDIGNLQIVPGLSVPITFTGNNSETGVFFYLSFEHPF